MFVMFALNDFDNGSLSSTCNRPMDLDLWGDMMKHIINLAMSALGLVWTFVQCAWAAQVVYRYI